MSALHNLQVERGYGVTQKVERVSLKTAHIEECVLGYLPKGFTLDGRRKLHIGLYPHKPTAPVPDDRFAGLLYHSAGHVSSVGVGKFSFEAYAKGDRSQRDALILTVIEKVLVAVAKRFGADTKAVRVAANQTRRNGYCCEYETELSRSSSDRSVRAHVIRRVEHRGISWRLDIRRKDGSLITQKWLKRFGAFNDIESDYFGSRVEGGQLILSDYRGRDRNRQRLDVAAA